MSDNDCGFRRARRPEQVEERRRAILDTAAQMLVEAPVADISLRELSTRVGLSKSNVLRYFETREAIFLEILEREQVAMLDEVAERLPASTNEAQVAEVVASSLIGRPLLCELMSAMASVLERNISVEFARGFKRRASDKAERLAELVHGALPHMSVGDAAHFAGITHILVAGLWPYAQPTQAVCTVMGEMGLQSPADLFASYLREGLIVHLMGLRARSEQSMRP
ncbi:TetR family transcriptional regulator [Mycobacteroides chelonae]|nr:MULTISPECIES: TetR/AcrR family transcriptional regulator [Mycobacteroides]KRQ30337.1 TetR family transcriptional regulator [Mycobacteroides sp. H072]KRQ35267.1 TetR family transcriptional regulator [Mycobacteroides sp. H002]KRQ55429.1 TetR family transcriptional regulator [Mycobacteroides sp. H054]KRQ66162.1 TetR family transcriptional regulator [Mycobacteroides sp. H001]MEC4840948.1 TetR family transcriptional regulator [Mycobacteroides chelonae]